MHRTLLLAGTAGVAVILAGCRSTPVAPPPTSNAVSNPAAQPADERWVKGSATSTATLIEYSDFECPACASYYWLLKQVVPQTADRVRFSYRHFPLRQTHANAQLAAQAAEAAGQQGKFWEMHDRLFEGHDEWAGKPDARARFTAYAKALGLDLARFTADLDARATADAVQADFQRGIEAGVRGTPTFYLNGRDLDHPGSVDEFLAAIEATLAPPQ